MLAIYNINPELTSIIILLFNSVDSFCCLYLKRDITLNYPPIHTHPQAPPPTHTHITPPSPPPPLMSTHPTC